MYIDYIFSVYYIIVNIIAAFVFTYVKNNTIPYYHGLSVNVLLAIGSVSMLKYSELSLLKQSALITLTSRFGYLVGLILVGEHISYMQWVGMGIITLGSIMTNR